MVEPTSADAVLVVRRTRVADWEALRTVRLRALAEDPDAFGSTHEQALAVPDEEHRRRAAAGTTHLALADGEPVGIVGLVRDDGDPSRGELVSTWVDPRHRGTGLAERLVEAACAAGRVGGVREVGLWVVAGNDRARRLYERCGVPTGEEQPVRPDEPDHLEERMRRTPAAPAGGPA